MRIVLCILASLFITSTAFAAKPSSGTITVPDAVHGGTTVATVTDNIVRNNTEGNYVLVQCYNPDYVYAAYFAVDENNQALLGPLTSSLWTSGPANCVATEGYFTKMGWGKWVVIAQTTFNVT